MRWISSVALCLLLAPIVRADSGKSLFDPNRDMRVSEVRPGMKGYGLSVFSGTKIERFDVEVVSVLKNFNPRYDVILVNCHGQNLEHTGAIAGMSGSPIFLRDDQGRERMAGAFAYGFPMAKDPIGGVQPIEYMLNLPTTLPSEMAGSNNATANVQELPSSEKKLRWSLRDAILLPGMKKPPRDFPLASRMNLTPNPMLGGNLDENAHLQPLVTPLLATGMSSRVIDEFGPLFEAYGFHLLQAGSTVSGSSAIEDAPAKIEPGSVLSAPLITGDMDLVATGTCTETLGDRVFAFGHSFNNEGAIDLPMGGGQINGIIATLTSSFKLGSMSRVEGALLTDNTVGVAGKLGPAPPMVPMELRLVYSDGSSDVTYHFNAVRHPRFTPLITAVAVQSVLSGEHELPQYHTADYDITIDFTNGKSVRVQNSAVNIQPQDFFLELATPMIAAAENPFERVLPTKMTGTINISPGAREAQILSVNLPKLKYKPGDTVKAYVVYRPFHQVEEELPISFTLPKDLVDGSYQFVVSDWQRYLSDEQESKPFKFEAGSIQDVFSVLDDMQKIQHSAVYVRLVRQADGVAIGRSELPHLPTSAREVLLASGRSDVTPYVSSDVATIPTQFVMSGSADFEITIDSELRIQVGNNPPIRTDVVRAQQQQAAPQPPQKGDEPKKPKDQPLPEPP